MSLVFGTTFNLTYVETPQVDQIASMVQKTSVFGVHGHTVLDGGRTARPLSVPFWFYGGYGTEQSLVTALLAIEQTANAVDSLTVNSVTYGQCRFLGFQGMRRHYSAQHTSWMGRATALFEQLQP